MDVTDNQAAKELVDVLRKVVSEELNKRDTTVLCEVVSRADERHFDVVDLSDSSRTIIHNITSMLAVDVNVGDFVYVYKIKNNYNNSFIVYKMIPYSQ